MKREVLACLFFLSTPAFSDGDDKRWLGKKPQQTSCFNLKTGWTWSTDKTRDTLDSMLSFYPYSPSRKNINSIEFPRNGEILARGTSPEQLSISQAVKAMLGFKDVVVESKMLTSIRLNLMGKTPPFPTHCPVLDKEVDELKSRFGNMSYREALWTAASLISDFYLETRNDTEIQHLFDYRADTYHDLPSVVIFSTVYPMVSSRFANPYTFTFRERVKRSIDANYYNFRKNKKWIVGSRHDTYIYDKGEFFTPVYIPGEDLLGIEIRDQAPSPVEAKYRFQRISFAFYRFEYEGQSFVVVLDGRRADGEYAQVVIPRSDGYYFGQSNIGRVVIPELPRRLDEKMKMIGILKLCLKDRDCSLPKGLYDLFEESSSRLPEEYVNEIAKISEDNTQVKFFFGE